jgi:hypothetical protein
MGRVDGGLCACAVPVARRAAAVVRPNSRLVICISSLPVVGSLSEQGERNARHVGDDHQVGDEDHRNTASGRISCSMLTRAIPQAMKRFTPPAA